MSRHTLSIALALLIGTAGAGLAQGPEVAEPRLEIVLPGIDLLTLRVPPSLQPGGLLGPSTTPTLAGARWLEETLGRVAEAKAERRRRRLQRVLGLTAAAVPADSVERPRIALPRPEDLIEPEAEPEGPRIVRSLAAYADLGLDLRTRLMVKFDHLRNNRCTVGDIGNPASGCQGGFPTPSFSEDFRVRAGGIVSQRVHVNVDFDSEREFSANNTINVFYQGLEDEILRRVDVGNIDFRAPPSRFITAAVPANSF
ncbi:MAG: hypothetical protein PVF27_04030, partial [Gemmatimonadales bacterium]